MPNISMSTVDLINNKLRQAMAITLLVQGDPSSDAPLNETHIGYALSAVYDLMDRSYEALNNEVKPQGVAWNE